MREALHYARLPLAFVAAGLTALLTLPVWVGHVPSPPPVEVAPTTMPAAGQ